MNSAKTTVIAFLKRNGFKRMDKNIYANDMCSVVLEDGYYAVANNYGSASYSNDENIYWLIGNLTYRGFMDKNYNK